MFSSRTIVRAAVCLLALSSTAVARADAPLSLSLSDALERATQRAPEVVMGTHAVREARARRSGAGIVVPINPRLNVEGRPPLHGGGTFPTDMGYASSLEVLFDVGGAPSARVREANRAAEAAEADLGADRLRARSAAWSAYIRTRVADERIDETGKLIQSADRILSASRQRASAGAAGDIEAAIATGDLAQLRAALEDARRQRETRLSELRDVLDRAAAGGAR